MMPARHHDFVAGVLPLDFQQLADRFQQPGMSIGFIR